MKYILVFMISCFSWPLLSDSKGEIIVRHEAFVEGSQITLGEVADFRNLSREEESQLRSIRIGKSPEAGREMTWKGEELSRAFKKLSSPLFGFQIFLPGSLTIRQGKKSASAEGILEIVKKEIASREKGVEVEIASHRIPRTLSLKKNEDYRVSVPQGRSSGFLNIQFDILEGDKPVSTKWFPVEVILLKKVPVAKRVIEARSPITDSDFTWEKKNIRHVNGPIADVQDLKDADARTSIVPGMVITRSLLERKVAVRAGDDLKLIAGDETFEVNTRATSTQNGFIGDVIRVKNSYNKLISARIVSKGVVKVDYQ